MGISVGQMLNRLFGQVLSSNRATHEMEGPKENVTPIRRRLQINLATDTERMLNELVQKLSTESKERTIKVNEVIQALVLNLYDARRELNLTSLPQRGRWGSHTAKAFPVFLAQVMKEAIVRQNEKRGRSLKGVVGG